MKSLFPGMDPYLEAHWLDVHGSLIAAARNQLNTRLPDDLIARSEERLVIDATDWESSHVMRPDVRVFAPATSEADEGGVAIEAPFKLVVDLEPLKQRYIKIIRPDDETLIAVIEFISPANKSGRGIDNYLANRGELLDAGVHVVEIDLVRQGDWPAILRPHLCPREAIALYRATVRIGGHPGAAYLFPIRLDDQLPSVPIPLRTSDPKVSLELQPLIEHVYLGGRYDRTIDYSRPCDPPLSDNEANWTRELLNARRK